MLAELLAAMARERGVVLPRMVGGGAVAARSDPSDQGPERSERKNASQINAVPTYPIVPTANDNLGGVPLDAEGLPCEPCPRCGGCSFVEPAEGGWLCRACEMPMPPPAANQAGWRYVHVPEAA